MIEYENLGKLNKPFFDEYKKSFEQVLDSGWYILGNQVAEFEKEFASFCGAKYCIGVANGLDALTISLKAFDFPGGSEVLVPSNTYIATILAIVNANLKPVLVEPELETYNIDVSKIEKAITSKTKAIMPVHLYGRMANMPAIIEIAKKYNLKIVEDAAQAHNASINGKKVGSWGDFTAFSFYPTKNLGALGDAGAITTNNEELYNKVKAMRNYGSNIKYHNEYIGMNSRLSEVQASFLRIKLKKLEEITQHKEKLADIYYSMLKDTGFILPAKIEGYRHVYHIFNVRSEKRDELKSFLLENGVKTEIHYPIAPNKQIAMKGILDGFETPIAEEIHNTTLSLPISYFHTEQDIKQVCEVLRKFNTK